MKLRHILCPVDFSTHNLSAIEYAIVLAEANRSTVTFLHVHPPALFEASGEFDVEKKLIDVRADIVEFTEPVHAGRTIEVRHAVEFGLPVERITAFASEADIDLIVMSSHGRTGLGRVLLGSTAEGVMRHAACPVLVTKAEREAQNDSADHELEVQQK